MIIKVLSLICLIVILSCSSKNTKGDGNNGNDAIIRVLTYGYPPHDDYQRSKVAKKYGFMLVPVAGCMITKELRDSAERINRLAFAKIKKLKGSNWPKRYEIDVLSEFKRDSSIISKIKKLDFIVSKNKELAKLGNGLHFFVDSLVGKETYRVSIESYLDTTHKWVSFFRIYFNYPNLVIDSIDKNIKLIHDYKKITCFQ
jgi:hypothetical protein